jgi:hypothetical protein
VEQVVEVDGAFVDRYLNDGDIDASELHAPLEQALREGHLIPVCFRLGAHRRRRGRAAGRDRPSCCPTRPKATRRTS